MPFAGQIVEEQIELNLGGGPSLQNLAAQEAKVVRAQNQILAEMKAISGSDRNRYKTLYEGLKQKRRELNQLQIKQRIQLTSLGTTRQQLESASQRLAEEIKRHKIKITPTLQTMSNAELERAFQQEYSELFYSRYGESTKHLLRKTPTKQNIVTAQRSPEYQAFLYRQRQINQRLKTNFQNRIIKAERLQVAQLAKRLSLGTVMARASIVGAVAYELIRFVTHFSVLEKNIAKTITQQELRRLVLQRLSKNLQNIAQLPEWNTPANSIKASATVDTRSFDQALRRYMEYTKKDLVKVVNQKSYWIARNAVYMTKNIASATIKADLNKPSRINSSLTVAEAIVVSQNKGKKLSQSEFKQKVKSLIGKRSRSGGYLRTGWIQAVKVMSPYAEKKTSAFVENRANANLGSAVAAMANNQMKYKSTIWTNVKSPNFKTQNVLEGGVQLAMDKEARSMTEYVNRKLQEGANRFNKGG